MGSWRPDACSFGSSGCVFLLSAARRPASAKSSLFTPFLFLPRSVSHLLRAWPWRFTSSLRVGGGGSPSGVVADSLVLLLVEDDPTLAEIVERYFTRAGFRTVVSLTGADVVDLLLAERPDVVLMDLTLPSADGLVLASEIRKLSDVPIIFLTARTSEFDKVAALDIGDDYVTKPFSARELEARIGAVLRRVSASEPVPPALVVAGYSVNWLRREVRDSSGVLVMLTHKELELLWFFVNHANQALTRETLFDKVWGSAAISSSRTLDVHVANLRRKLPGLPLTTIRGTGYRLDATPEVADA